MDHVENNLAVWNYMKVFQVSKVEVFELFLGATLTISGNLYWIGKGGLRTRRMSSIADTLVVVF